ncbi:hypothetical protein C8Q76DRAFT_699464 [Earliella scabrosa]|nr:hypothetical protein C8Q76DRAFT_699464 [Earliella scabrosa]
MHIEPKLIQSSCPGQEGLALLANGNGFVTSNEDGDQDDDGKHEQGRRIYSDEVTWGINGFHFSAQFAGRNHPGGDRETNIDDAFVIALGVYGFIPDMYGMTEADPSSRGRRYAFPRTTSCSYMAPTAPQDNEAPQAAGAQLRATFATKALRPIVIRAYTERQPCSAPLHALPPTASLPTISQARRGYGQEREGEAPDPCGKKILMTRLQARHKPPMLDLWGFGTANIYCFWEVNKATSSSPSLLKSAMTFEDVRNDFEDMGMVRSTPQSASRSSYTYYLGIILMYQSPLLVGQ